MMTLLRLVVVALLLLLPAGLTPAHALDATPDQFDQKLKQYDPQAVEAALAYSKSLNLKEQFTKGVALMREGLTRQLTAQNPSLSKEHIDIFLDAFFQSALVDKSDVIEKASLLIMLDVFSKDEIVALAEFYASPIGKRIKDKLPQMMGRVPELQGVMMKHIVPEALQVARDKLKARGVDMKI